MNTQNNNQSSINRSVFYDVPSSDVRIMAQFKTLELTDIKHFISAFTQVYLVRINTTVKTQVLVKFVLFYLATIHSHRSDVASYLYRNRVFLNIPDWCQVHLLKVSTEVNSANKLSGTTTGYLTNAGTLDSAFDTVLNADQDTWIKSLEGTDFYEIVFDNRQFKRFTDELKQALKPYESNGALTTATCAEFVSMGLSLPASFVFYLDKFPMFRGYLEFGTSVQLGLYRFENCAPSDLYTTSQATFSALSPGMRDLYANVLKIFSPTFYIEGVATSVFPRHSCDMVISVESIPLVNSWVSYFSFVSTQPRNGPGKSFQRNTNNVNRNAPSVQKNVNAFAPAAELTENVGHVEGYVSGTLVKIPIFRTHKPNSISFITVGSWGNGPEDVDYA